MRFPGGHVYMGGFYRQGVIAPEREDPVFERYRKALVERHGAEKAAAVLAVDRFNNLVWPNVSINARFGAMRVVRPLAADHTVVEVVCFRLDGAPAEMHELDAAVRQPRRARPRRSSPPTISRSSSAASGASRAGRTSGSTCVAAPSPISARPTAPIVSRGTSELPIRHQFETWKTWLAQ